MDHSALIAMSGGVDSSVAAKLMLDGGWRCIGCTMKLYPEEAASPEGPGGCHTPDDVEAARSVAALLGIPFYVFNLQEDFRRDVICRFIRTYESGRTPNPCIDCNRYLKFGRLLSRAGELGCGCVATGHYARIEQVNGRYLLRKAADPAKDQTYFLACLTQDQLARVRFPLGGLHKAEVRALAREYTFPNARKPDSQDICFVPDGDYAAFMERYTHKTYPPGDFLDLEGRPVGRHHGAVRYTLGQRRGLNLALGRPVYVCGKDMESNTVTVGPESALYSSSLQAEELNWFPFDRLNAPLRVAAKTRYSQTELPATVRPLEEDRILVEFDAPQRAVTPGQTLVLYDGEYVVGSGTITTAQAERKR